MKDCSAPSSDARRMRRLFFVMLAAALLSCGLLFLRGVTENAVVLYVLFYALSLLSLFIGHVGLGGAFYEIARGRGRYAIFFILLSAACGALPLLAAAVRTALPYREYADFALVLWAQIGSALANALVSALIYGFILLLAWFAFFRRTGESGSPCLFGKSPFPLANLTATLVFLVYRLLLQIPQTVQFVREYWPNVYPGEILSIVLDYVFILLSLALGYGLLFLVEAVFSESEPVS